MMALARLLATLHDADGNVAVEGVSSFDWDGLDFSEEDLRTGADLAEGVDVIGTGTIGSRLWSKPSINAIGLDMTSVDRASNVLIPEARAKLSMRIVPDADPNAELDALVRHLETHAPATARGRRRCGLRPSIRRGVFVEFCGALAATAWEVQLAQLLVFDSDSAQPAQAIRRVVGW
jgi:acetylornithine deacetylase/succinyl-diaminopimelate desuccinylase-like protein